MIRVLALAPEVSGLPRLASAEELARIGDAPGVTLHSLVEVTRQRVIDRLSRDRYDVLVIIGHGGPGYVQLAGDRIDPQWLAEQLRNYTVSLAIVATCASSQRPEAQHLAHGFADVLPAAGIDCVTMDTSVADRAALEYDVACLQSLASGSPLRRAHEAGVAAAALCGAGQQPRLTPRDATVTGQQAGQVATGRKMDDGYVYRLGNNEQLLRTMDGKMDKLAEQVGNVILQQKLQEERMATLSRKVDSLDAVVMGMQAPNGYSRAYLAAGAVVMAIMLLLLVFVTWRLL